jgi:hypothetical protein
MTRSCEFASLDQASLKFDCFVRRIACAAQSHPFETTTAALLCATARATRAKWVPAGQTVFRCCEAEAQAHGAD